MEKINYLHWGAFQASRHNFTGPISLIRNLESLYSADEIPVGNSGLARQRSFGNNACWKYWFFCSPQVQGKVDGEKIILFDDRPVAVDHLDDHPLLNPSFLRDHWSEMNTGALAVPRRYFSALVDLSQNSRSGVRAVLHKDFGAINPSFPLAGIENHAYLKAFLGLPDEERMAYLQEHKKRYESIYLNCILRDADQKNPEGRLSVFGSYDDLYGSYDLGNDCAHLLGVCASAASFGAEGAP